jgi:hypothetical protein
MPLFITKPWAYLQIRNHILRLWSDNLLNYLSIQQASTDIQEKFKPFVAPIFHFLQRYGYINTGVLSTPNPERGKSCREFSLNFLFSGTEEECDCHWSWNGWTGYSETIACIWL